MTWTTFPQNKAALAGQHIFTVVVQKYPLLVNHSLLQQNHSFLLSVLTATDRTDNRYNTIVAADWNVFVAVSPVLKYTKSVCAISQYWKQEQTLFKRSVAGIGRVLIIWQS